MRTLLALSACAFLATSALAANGAADGHDRARDEDRHDERAPRRCLPAQAVVPPFNNTAGAMDQARVAATIVYGDTICQTSAEFPEASAIEHGEEDPVRPDDVAIDPGAPDAQVAEAPAEDYERDAAPPA